MSIYDGAFTSAIRAGFGEQITYTVLGMQPKVINAVVFRKPNLRAKLNQKHINIFPIELFISRADIPVVTEMSDVITMPDIAGAMTNYKIRHIIYSDPGVFKIGLS